MDGQGGTSIHLRESDLKSVKVIGYGASATVSKAFYPRINRFVALKRISHLEKQQRSQMLKDLHTLLVLYQKECPGLVSFMGAFMSSEQARVVVVEPSELLGLEWIGLPGGRGARRLCRHPRDAFAASLVT